ncbi:uncharacterized protein PFL1_03192 [Pseudozyma flocculosa PF-1]|uniref:25S rRNA (uridine-N(3))-methyltransferase BMT5-like domain-containing protein n=2 Tax=Pseudozyma flocculosa TaxID=84751 RepID=A0A5C3F3V2_9BASI|nr:uncharacterized protein PFL1_03192 [Pseudozyma flocculosa PF-1]EPQ29437.1 hypothetical protein PFL1_03192 [Pseudozyma flocculosa PF-1]SPO37961.1 uncharacterized protein PSFLO_03438 [Pseudozyma flocculosa]
MPKKGSLKKAFASFNRQQDEKNHHRAVQEAVKRKAESLTRSNKRQKPNASPRKQPATGTGGAGSPDSSSGPRQSGAACPQLPAKRTVEPFGHDDTILIVGEANFSFTLSLLSQPRNHSPSQILATAYDSEQECYRKYPDAESNVRKIRELAAREDVVVFGVDAGQLDKVKQVTGKSKAGRSADPLAPPPSTRRWSKVWFGFPHVGAGHKDETRNVLANQLLLLRFFISVAPYLTDGPLPKHAAAALGQSQRPLARADSEEPDPMVGEDEEGEGLDILDAFKDATEAEREALAASRARQPFRPPVKRGSVLITLRNAAPYTLWSVATLGKRLPEMLSSIVPIAPPLPKGCKKPTLADLDAHGLSRDSRPAKPVSTKKPGAKGQRSRDDSRPRRGTPRHYQLWRSFEFEPSRWNGYEHRRTVGWVEGVSAGDNEDLLRLRNLQTDPNERASRAGGGECRTWEFGLD